MPAALRKLLRALPQDSPSFGEIKGLRIIARDREDVEFGGFRNLVKRLNEAAVNNDDKAAAALIKESCAGIHSRLGLSPASAAYAIAPLLALACREGAESLGEVKVTIQRVLNDEQLTDLNLSGVSRGCCNRDCRT